MEKLKTVLRKPQNALSAVLKKKAPALKPEAPEAPLCEILPFDGKDYRTLSLLLNGFKQAVDEPALTHLEWSALRTGIEEDRITYYIAWQNGHAVGLFSLCRTFSSYKCAAGGIFEDFYVLPEVRGTGVARALVQHACATVRGWGGRTLTVTCAECDAEMYRALGFRAAIGQTLSQEL